MKPIIFSRITELKNFLTEKKKNYTIGFVPTMGALHEGHLNLVRRAKSENGFCVVSIFVNPIQFNDKSDFDRYPRELEKDVEKLATVDCDCIFAPSPEEMYPEPDTTVFNFGQLEKVMEGAFRPGHFNGVAIVVRKLFNIVEPTRAYFGEKDYQQLLIVKELVRREKIAVEIVACPTVREADGLAMSSRNALLLPEHRAKASLIFKVLTEAKSKYASHTPAELKKWAMEQLSSDADFKPEYFEIADALTLQPVDDWASPNGIVACTAVFLGKIRLIDNIRII